LYKKWKAGGEVTLEDLIDAGIEMHAGNHTRVSITSLSATFPDNPLFWFQQFICHLLPANEEVFEAIRTAGALSNVKARLSKNQKWYDTTYTMHLNLVALKARYEGRAPPSSELKRLKNSWVVGHGLSQGTMSSYYLLANLDDAFWDKLWAVISGNGIPDSEKKKFKKWTSSNTFNQMSLSEEMIPHDTLQSWLEEGMMGNMSAAQFRKECLMYKCSMRLRKEIIEHLHTLYLQAKQSDPDNLPISTDPRSFDKSWTYVEDQFRSLASIPFLNTYIKMQWDQPVRSGFPEALFDDCEAAFRQGTTKDNDEKIEVHLFTHSSFDYHL
jgi:hypothetical protein